MRDLEGSNSWRQKVEGRLPGGGEGRRELVLNETVSVLQDERVLRMGEDTEL